MANAKPSSPENRAVKAEEKKPVGKQVVKKIANKNMLEEHCETPGGIVKRTTHIQE